MIKKKKAIHIAVMLIICMTGLVFTSGCGRCAGKIVACGTKGCITGCVGCGDAGCAFCTECSTSCNEDLSGDE